MLQKFLSLFVISVICFFNSTALAKANEEPQELSISGTFLSKKLLELLQPSEELDATHAPAQESSPFAPLSIRLQSTVEMSPLPVWAKEPFVIKKESSSIEIPIPSIAEQSQIENFALTVNFYDMGDGGPLVESVKPSGERTLISSGLGINGPALGLNSRTIAIPADLALDGGTIIVSHTGRFERLQSIVLRPGRTAMVSVLGEKETPAIMDGSEVLEQEVASGALPPSKKGYVTHGRVSVAELSAPIEQLSDTLEFAFDLTGHPEATLFRTEIQGLDLEAHVEVELNGIPVGPLNLDSFQLDSPKLIMIKSKDVQLSSFQYAGWRNASLYIPNYLWKEKNHLLLTVKQGMRSSGSKIHLKNSCLEILHEKAPQKKKDPNDQGLMQVEDSKQ